MKKQTKTIDIKIPKKLQKKAKEFEEAIEYHLISTNFKPLDGRTKVGKPLKAIAKIADFSMYVLSCAALSAIIIYVIFQ